MKGAFILKFIALGGAGEVGASCYLLEIAGKKILLDAGLRVNRLGKESLPYLNKLDHVDLVIISHAHMDHSGAIPLVYKRFPEAPIICTYPTKLLSEVLWKDSVKIWNDLEEEGGPAPLYDLELVEQTSFKLQDRPFNEWFEPIPDIKLYLHPSGHIMGAAAVLIDTEDAKVVFTGDMSAVKQRTVDGMEPIDFFNPNVVITESTYGGNIHASRKAEEQALARDIGDVLENGGTVLIPSFALGRAQELILILVNSMRGGQIPKYDLYVDGMVRTICDLYSEMEDDWPQSLKNFVKNSRQPLYWNQGGKNIPKVEKVNYKERYGLLVDMTPKIIISSSGMLTGGPSVLYAQSILERDNGAIFFTGYQDEEAPGRALLELKTGDEFQLADKKFKVRCKIGKYNLSAHADQIHLCQQLSYMSPDAVILIHGEREALQSLRTKLLDKYVVWVAQNGAEINPLESPKWLGESTAMQLEVENLIFTGTLQEFKNGRVGLKFEEDLAGTDAFKKFFSGFTRVEGKVRGNKLIVKAVPEEDKSQT